MSKAVMLSKVIISVLFAMAALAAVQHSNAPPTNADTVSHGTIRLRPDESLFNPSSKKALSYHDDGVVMALVNGKNNLAVDIESASQTRGRVELPPEIVQVNEIRAAPSGKAIVVGMVNGSVFEIAILNTLSMSIADTFLAYTPSVSPDGRFVAFVKFYPAHFVEGTDDHYLIYDVARSAVENRPTNGALTDHTNVGIPVYPPVANHDGDNTSISERQRHHMLAQTFFWRSDSVRYAFADDHAGDWDLLVISMLDGRPITTKTTVVKSEICALLRKEVCQVTLAEAELTADALLAKFRGVGADSALEQVTRYRYQRLSSVQ
jgi:hypothetical protein